MDTQTKEFLSILNEHYPFERYILKKHESINSPFDDVVLTEIFVPSTEYYKKIDIEKVYVKLKCKDVEFCLCLFDFDDTVINNIRWIVIEDIGGYEWESLYVEREDYDEYESLKKVLLEQKIMITDKYGICTIKESCIDDTNIDLIKEN